MTYAQFVQYYNNMLDVRVIFERIIIDNFIHLYLLLPKQVAISIAFAFETHQK